MMTEDDIRVLNCDFNYHNYGVFYEKIEEEANAGSKAADEAAPKEGEGEEGKDGKAEAKGGDAAAKGVTDGFQKIVSDENLLNKMWQRADVDLEKFKDKYEDWLDEEVWTYFD